MSPVSDNNHFISKVDNLKIRKHLWSSSSVRKEKSPMVKASLYDVLCHPIIDEGSEINCLSEQFLIKNEIEYEPTKCSASTANSSSLARYTLVTDRLTSYPLSPLARATTICTRQQCLCQPSFCTATFTIRGARSEQPFPLNNSAVNSGQQENSYHVWSLYSFLQFKTGYWRPTREIEGEPCQ